MLEPSGGIMTGSLSVIGNKTTILMGSFFSFDVVIFQVSFCCRCCCYSYGQLFQA